MRFRAPPAWIALLTAVAALLPASGGAARPADITGTLARGGLTVIAVAEDGRATTAWAGRGTFRIRPPAARVSLHLRRSDGRYAGPIVITAANRGRRAILGVRAGTRLGRVSVDERRGYGRVLRPPVARRVDAVLWARARGGVPIGAGVFGRVSTPKAQVPGDRDADGVVDPLDIDDDGDLVLDNLERPTARAQAEVSGFDTELHLMNVLATGINRTSNANAGTSPAQSDLTLAEAGYLIISEMAGDSAELDCGLLSYCRPGGTGQVFGTDPPLEFPECCDPDRDGLGTIARNPSLPSPRAGMFLRHGATTQQIKTGDVLIERVTTGGVETAYPATLQYVFASVPALASYRDTAPVPHAATVTYPVPFGAPGTPGRGSGFPVSAGPDGDVVVHLRFWRPQRRRIEGEAGGGDWTDIGGLTYVAGPQIAAAGAFTCPRRSFSELGSDLVVPTGATLRGGGVTDTAPDRPADPENVVAFTLNISQCLASKGLSWAPGTDLSIGFRGIAANALDSAEQVVGFRRVP